MSSRILAPEKHPTVEAMPWRTVAGEIVESTPSLPALAAPAHAEAKPARFEEELEARARAAFETGRQQGEKAGEQRALAQVDSYVKRLARTIEDLARTRDEFRREAERDVVALAVAVARRILHRELTVDPEALLGLVKAALERVDARELHRVLVHPEDQPAVSHHVRELKLPKRVEVVGDPALERGAALFETARGTLDASIQTQLEEIELGFSDAMGTRRA